MKSKTKAFAALCSAGVLSLCVAGDAMAQSATPPGGNGDCADHMGPMSIHHADFRPDRPDVPFLPPAMGPVPGMEPGHGVDGPMPPFLRGVNLSDDQQDKIFTILHDQAPRMRLQARAAHKAREQLHQLATADKYDDAQAKELAEAGGKAETEIALMRAQADHEIVALLTPEQRQQAFTKKCTAVKY
jgi:Spy/CpxP family protein refolding chaperone